MFEARTFAFGKSHMSHDDDAEESPNHRMDLISRTLPSIFPDQDNAAILTSTMKGQLFKRQVTQYYKGRSSRDVFDGQEGRAHAGSLLSQMDEENGGQAAGMGSSMTNNGYGRIQGDDSDESEHEQEDGQRRPGVNSIFDKKESVEMTSMELDRNDSDRIVSTQVVED